MSQTTYNLNQQSNIEGLVADERNHVVESRAIDANGAIGVGFGLAAVVSINDARKAMLPTLTGQKFIGFTGRTVQYPMPPLGSQQPGVPAVQFPGYPDDSTANLVKRGMLWVQVVTGLTILDGDPVYMVYGGADKGKLTNVATGHDAVPGRATFRVMPDTPVPANIAYVGPAGTPDLALVDINLP